MARVKRLSNMDKKKTADAFQMFAESKGVYLQPRQLDFCHGCMKYHSSVQAAKAAGYPDVERIADELYTQFRDLIEEWRYDQKADYYLVLNTLREAASQTVKPHYYQDALVEDRPDMGARRAAAKDLGEMLGFNAAKEFKVEIGVGVDEDMRKRLDSVYKQAPGK